jgi:hypothetical protein
VTFDNRVSMNITRPNITIGLPERETPMQSPCRLPQGNPLHREESFHKTGSGMAPTNRLGVHCQSHRRVQPGAWHAYAHDASVYLRCHLLWLGSEEVALQYLGARPCSPPPYEGAHWCSRSLMW